ncbi:MAG: hypothetical protein AAGM84_16540 [Pseudomonadota bacterium]
MDLCRIFFVLVFSASASAAPARDGDAAARAAWAVAEVLLAVDLAGACPHFARTKGGYAGNSLLSDALVTFINERDLTMTDFAAAAEVYGAADMDRLKRWLLARDRVDPRDRRAVCFYAKRIAGTDHVIGRFLERR